MTQIATNYFLSTVPTPIAIGGGYREHGCTQIIVLILDSLINYFCGFVFKIRFYLRFLRH